ncbi:hypothetical protein BT69DRAFT_1359046 [Atractiella rhizophila]|nr:hypothetical protein BT69DRAFT_1359046 [Atractiella rhizophila]
MATNGSDVLVAREGKGKGKGREVLPGDDQLYGERPAREGEPGEWNGNGVANGRISYLSRPPRPVEYEPSPRDSYYGQGGEEEFYSRQHDQVHEPSRQSTFLGNGTMNGGMGQEPRREEEELTQTRPPRQQPPGGPTLASLMNASPGIGSTPLQPPYQRPDVSADPHRSSSISQQDPPRPSSFYVSTKSSTSSLRYLQARVASSCLFESSRFEGNAR